MYLHIKFIDAIPDIVIEYWSDTQLLSALQLDYRHFVGRGGHDTIGYAYGSAVGWSMAYNG